MKTITIPESEYKALKKTNNNLRKLLNQFISEATELVNGEGAAPNALAPKKLTRKQIRENFLKRIK